jgi:hypothetical protein
MRGFNSLVEGWRLDLKFFCNGSESFSKDAFESSQSKRVWNVERATLRSFQFPITNMPLDIDSPSFHVLMLVPINQIPPRQRQVLPLVPIFHTDGASLDAPGRSRGGGEVSVKLRERTWHSHRLLSIVGEDASCRCQEMSLRGIEHVSAG